MEFSYVNYIYIVVQFNLQNSFHFIKLKLLSTFFFFVVLGFELMTLSQHSYHLS
jgi:hypothetical protein